MTKIAIPDSVHSYIHDSRVRDAVDRLVKSTGDHQTSLFQEWTELGSYADAWLAAKVCKADWFRWQHDIFEKIIDPQVTARGWESFRIADIIAKDYYLPSPKRSWERGWYGREYRRANIDCGFYFHADTEGMHCSFEITGQRIKTYPDGWRKGDEQGEGYPEDVFKWPRAKSLTTRKITEQMREALDFVDGFTGM